MAQGPLTNVHQSYLKPVKRPAHNGGRGQTQGKHGPSIAAGRANGKPGLDPREALDILDIRTGKPGGTAELAVRTDAGPDVLHYLAVQWRAGHAPGGRRQYRRARPHQPLLADDECEDVRAELAVKIARLMPGLSERESSHMVALTIETLDCLARDATVRVRAILAEEIKYLDCIPHDIVMRLARTWKAWWRRPSWNIRHCCRTAT
jgi:hypothetical protein